MAAVVKAALVPGSLPFLVLGVAGGVACLYLGDRFVRAARLWLTSLTLLYLVLSLGPTSTLLITGLQGSHGTIRESAGARGARVVVVIGSGAVTYAAGDQALHQMGRRTAFSVLEAARVYRLIEPDWLVASGGIADPVSQKRAESEIMREALVTLGVPENRVLLESSSTTTAQQLSEVGRLLAARGLVGPVVVVATAAHMRRVMSEAAANGLDAIASVAEELRYHPGGSGWRRWRPSLEALRGSESALYEHLAFAYYWLTRRAGGAPV